MGGPVNITEQLHKYAAFTSDPAGGNPAGVWIGDELPDPSEMQRIAADVGFSETAFVAPATGSERRVRYFSPEMEVPFCGHATIATGVVLADSDGDGVFRLDTPAGVIPVSVTSRDGEREAALTSATPQHEAASDKLLDDALAALDWSRDDLDRNIPPVVAFAGASHLVLAAKTRARLDDLDYDFDALKSIMLREDLITLQLIWRENDALFHSRNPFPVGGVIEDPATGAAAAALGGYLRVASPEEGGIVVSGTAVPM